MMKVGFIGLGAMGRPMAKNVRKAGFDLVVCDVNQEAVNEMVALGALAKDTAADVAAASDIICTSLPNSTILKNVVMGQDGLFNSIKPGALVIDLSSVEPAVARELSTSLKTKGAALIDAPVSGGVSGAIAGTLTIMVGASEEELAQAIPVLEAIGKNISHVGQVGSGQAMKLVNNLLLGINMAAVAEALTLGVKLGLEPQTMLDIIGQSSGRSYALEAKAPNFIFKGNFVPGFAVDLQYKDLELAVSTAKSLAQPLPMGNSAQQLFEIARAKGWGREDISAIVKFFEEMAGVEVRS